MRVEPGRFYDVELLHVEPDAPYTIDKVFLVHHEDDIMIGQPFVTGAIVNGTVLRHFRGRKIIVYKMRPKKKTRKKRGHRQEITRLMIDSISLDGKIIATASDAIAPTPEAISAPPEAPDTTELTVAEEPADLVITPAKGK